MLITFGGLDIGISYKLHYWLNKSEFQKLESQIDNHPELNEMTDMLRDSKYINSKYISNQKEYRTQQQIESSFGDYLTEANIDRRRELNRSFQRISEEITKDT